MKSKIVGILSCMMLLAAVPIAAGMTINTDPKVDPANIFDHTYVRGFVVLKRSVDGGKNLRFFALRIHYTTVSLNGEHKSGVMKLRPMIIPNSLKGYYGNFYIFASFWGSIS